MGYDVSYHPISEQEIKLWYLDRMDEFCSNPDTAAASIRELAQAHAIDEFYASKYLDTISTLSDSSFEQQFDRTHGYGIAVVQGLFRTYFYTRGSAFSFLIDDFPEYATYTRGWEEVIGATIAQPVDSRITGNYSSGVFIPHHKVMALLHDYENNPEVKADLDELFSHRRIEVFLKALNYCREHQLGLLEATDVMEPNPLDLNKSISYSNLYHCDTDGPLLFAEAAREQMSEAIAKHTAQQEQQPQPPAKPSPSEKKGFFARLFGK